MSPEGSRPIQTSFGALGTASGDLRDDVHGAPEEAMASIEVPEISLEHRAFRAVESKMPQRNQLVAQVLPAHSRRRNYPQLQPQAQHRLAKLW